ncbi:hypothetical protein G7Y89_g12137 [Cudoniella acicularis]|uniref:Uncharacterized protein n=1 Tax=Cudoniella acicularis TaxID=354080 RepID=A0A8H4VZG8_9HELO|nr:hypothetical protein G7Y89_g12137 [Cudoniella acicularis]
MATPPRNILLVVTVGGFTRAAPVLELGQVLSTRGDEISFATLSGQESWAKAYPFITHTHILGSALTMTQLDAHYKRSLSWDSSKGISNVMDSKYMFDSFWTETYHSLSSICQDPKTKLDMIIADFFVDAAKDMHIQYQIPLAVVWPQMPYLMAKPDYLVLVNSFWGLETPKDLPPLVAAVGPILVDEYPPLDSTYNNFFATHDKVIYIALGSHIILPRSSATKIIQGLCQALDQRLINGAIWAVSESACQEFDLNLPITIHGRQINFGYLIPSGHPDFYFPTFAPQRAILEHPHTKIYLTHGGGSSVNEGLFHGKPMIAMGFYFDQICNTARLVAGGSAESLHKTTFTPDELCEKIKIISEDKGGTFAKNCERLKRIANVASRRKSLAADLVEELIYDTESRFEEGKELRPMHLQTADMRMPFYKARNWDLMTFTFLGTGAFAGTMALGEDDLGSQILLTTTIIP